MAKFTRSYQVILYVAIAAFLGIFILYFYRLASSAGADLSSLRINEAQTTPTINTSNIKINLDLFTSPKFLRLRSDVAPVQSFPLGKRNPFQPQ